jgi:hypothetical protein
VVALGDLESVVAGVGERLVRDPSVITVQSVVFEMLANAESPVSVIFKLTGQSRDVHQVGWVALSQYNGRGLVLVSTWIRSHHKPRLLPQPGSARCTGFQLVDQQ